MAETEQTAFGDQRLVLVCENAPERQPIIRAALEQLGYTMLPAGTAEEAGERLRRHPFGSSSCFSAANSRRSTT